MGVTGGIATGKSTAAQALLRQFSAELFDVDRCSRELLDSNEPAIHRVVEAFGLSILGSDGRIDRKLLREAVFSNAGSRKILEGILHPLIRERWIAAAEAPRGPRKWLIVDIPLLFETGAECALDRTLVIACAASTQRHRLRHDRLMDAALLENIIGAQLDIEAKMLRANHVIWNDSTISCLERQVALFARWLTEYYG